MLEVSYTNVKELKMGVEKIIKSKDIYKDSNFWCTLLDDVKDENIEYKVECNDDEKHCKITKTILSIGGKKMEFPGRLSKKNLLDKLEKSCDCGCALKKVEY
jgi:hypothetical protein